MTEKQEWIIKYIKRYGPVDVANETFIQRYVEKFNSDSKDIGRQLSLMFKINKQLERVAYGLPAPKIGQPKWVYVYRLISE
ncbi:hypothetical protein [Paenibacillus tianjinensis]|uniref:Uncharacterized protein n=1 Tax=Paenibacillus tianjinensis TaxID=2810347 RepID=A0ABX7L5N5_9BACL|nr:hypothetical protein [Paenibacillus tianjinensis]QSF43425.1 hypothetical protein JRJ22_19365 [Paenibacillus tianjinensis]